MKRVVRRHLRTVVDHWLKPFDLKLVNRHRMPRGCFETLSRTKQAGLTVDHVIDIGAAEGKWALQCMKVFPAAQYWLIEARPAHEPALTTLKAHHRNLDFDICTLGGENKQVPLYEHGNQTSALPSEYAQSSEATVMTVNQRTVDSLIKPEFRDGPLLLKLDVQGYELEVLRGGEALLADPNLQLLLTEVSFRRIYDDSPLAHEVIRFAAQHGFRIFDICSYCPRPHDLALAQCDLLFAREESGLFEHEGWS